MLTTDLEPEEHKDWAALDLFLTTIIKELDLTGKVGKASPLPQPERNAHPIFHLAKTDEKKT